jgi:hypothetical protein
MAATPELEASIAAGVAAMAEQERYDRAAEKLVLGPQAKVQDFVKMLTSRA